MRKKHIFKNPYDRDYLAGLNDRVLLTFVRHTLDKHKRSIKASEKWEDFG